ncbi:MAG: hypothetical protein TEF_04465 [Rhizobiales bacterium NRL2]|jgi:hypothetical protein|nr:MAG: hypothetical protein TEF_04465 [Rhizobiales bacterium NRL2]
MNTSMIDYAGGGDSGRKMHRFTYRDTAYEVPDQFWDREAGDIDLAALLKSQADLRRQVSGRMKAPESYDLRVPEDIADRVAIDPADPAAAAAMAWAKKHGLSQEAFGELVEGFARAEADARDPEAFHTAQMAQLKEAYGHRCDEVCQEVGHWFGALLQRDFADRPELLEAAEELASDARGVMLLKALRDRLTERGVPGHRDQPAAGMDEAALRRLQASDAYLNARHPDHDAVVRKVRDGWQRLVG